MSTYQMPGSADKSITRDELERVALEGAQKMLAAALGVEVTAFLGRLRYQRGKRKRVGYRNGFHRPRRVVVGLGQVEVRVPRVRATEEPFESAIVRNYERSSSRVKEMIPSLYLHGLATGDFEPALRGLLGESAPLSPASVVRLKKVWEDDYNAWKTRPLEPCYAYVWADGIYLKAGLGDEKAALLTILGVNSDGSKELLAMVEGYRESVESWKDVLRDLKERGVQEIRLLTADGHLGIWGALNDVFPEANGQRCWVHKMGNVLDKMPKKKQGEAKALLREAYHAPTRADAEMRIKTFAERFGAAYPRAVECLQMDQESLLRYYDFPKAHWRTIRTTNPIESIFSSVRLRTNATRRMRTARTALYLVYQLVRVAERNWRRLDSPELVANVIAGHQFKNGEKKPEDNSVEEHAAA